MRSHPDSTDRVLGVSLLVILVIGFVGVAAVAGVYYWHFKDFPLAKDPSAWGQLGDYFGGVLNPVLGFLSLIGLLVTIYLNQKELRLSRMEISKGTRAAERQADHLESEAEKSELLKVIDLIHSELRVLLERKITHEIRGADGQVRERREFSYVQLLQSPTNFSWTIPQKSDGAAIPFVFIGGRLTELQEYLAKYDRIAQSLTLSQYYRQRYCLVAKTLSDFEFIDPDIGKFFARGTAIGR